VLVEEIERGNPAAANAFPMRQSPQINVWS